jgi:hypothetical protein
MLSHNPKFREAMKRAVGVIILGLSCVTFAAGAELAACGVTKGLYEEWLRLTKPAGHKAASTLIDGAPAAAEPDRQKAIAKEYENFFRCLSDTAEHKDVNAVLERCRDVEVDRVAWLACRTAAYLRSGRADGKDFLDSLPTGKKGAELIWDLDAVGGNLQAGSAPIFLPDGPAYKLIDELFLLVLDDKDTAAGKYLALASLASGNAARHVDEQLKLLLRESPSVVVKRWMVFRQYQPKLRKVLADMTASLTAAEMQKMRKGLGAFCSKENPDCPEIIRLFGKLE